MGRKLSSKSIYIIPLFSVWEPLDEREVLETFFWLWYGGMIEQQGLSSNLPVPEGQAVCTKGL